MLKNIIFVQDVCGGEDADKNLVNLTAREHFIAHYILARLSKGTKYEEKLMYAFSKMACIGKTKRKLTPSQYELVRRTTVGIQRSEETRKKLSLKQRGVNVFASMTPERYKEVCAKQSASMKGVNTWMKGRVWWTNGIAEKQCKECPR